MNRISGKINRVEIKDEILLLEIDTKIGTIFTLVIETPKFINYIREDKESINVYLVFSKTEVLIAKTIDEDLLNVFKCKVLTIESGILLSKLLLEKNGVFIESLMLTKELKKLRVKAGDEVLCRINPLSILIEVN